MFYTEGQETNYGKEVFESEAVGREMQAIISTSPQSSGDVEEEIDEKIRLLEQRDLPEKTYFEQSQYFDRLFPGLRIQKPGSDYYGSTTLLLAILAIFVLNYFEKLYVSQSDLLDGAKNSGIFNGAMAVCLLTIVFIIILERYISRTDTKSAEGSKKATIDEIEQESRGYF